MEKFMLLLLISITIVSALDCEYFVQPTILRCVSPLVEYFNPQLYTLHPPLNNPAFLCRKYSDYKECTRSVPSKCRKTLAGTLEYVYEFICDEKMRASIHSQRQCFLGMSADVAVRECYINATEQLKTESETTDNNIFTETYLSEKCNIMQGYLNCLVENDYWKLCPDAMELEKKILDYLGEDECKLTVVKPKPDNTKPKCDKQGFCSCNDGYAYDAESRTCADVNECEEPGICSQTCQNSVGSFKCDCDERYYKLDDDQQSCIRKDDRPLWIFFAHGQSIWNISQDGKDFQLQRAGLQKTAMIDIDIKERRLYYADIGANKIERMRIEGAFPQTIQSYEVESLEGLAVDWIAKNIYTLRKANMFVQQLDGRFRRTLYTGITNLPRALAVNPIFGLHSTVPQIRKVDEIRYIYLSDWGSQAFIARAAMDGSKFEKIVTNGIVWPNGLAIDYYSQKLYWADAFLDSIECTDLNGDNRRTILSESSSVPHPFGLAIADDYIYWTDWTYRGILRADKRNGQNVTVLAQTALLPYGIKLFHPALQPQAVNPCIAENVGCSQLCLLSPNTISNDSLTVPQCACADGFLLEKDGKTCTSSCKKQQILCGGSDPRCISRIYWCDGVTQCFDHADELDCPRRICLPGQYQCHDNKKCLTAASVCDGTVQCDDESDEKFCP